jgi:hypothetical protein
MVPIARPLPSGFGTLVDTRMYSSPLFTKKVAVMPLPSSLLIASTTSKLLLIFVEPKYSAGASLPPTGSLPSTLGAPNWAAMALRLAIEAATRESACALEMPGISAEVAMKQPADIRPTRKFFPFMRNSSGRKRACSNHALERRADSAVDLARLHGGANGHLLPVANQFNFSGETLEHQCALGKKRASLEFRVGARAGHWASERGEGGRSPNPYAAQTPVRCNQVECGMLTHSA